ncbi:P-loop containing nucleoside triphosphate hydrolase protein [Piedraia hortae CBS 480.64]|uniref:P-loop containing nucleoside triphosphate hydrolase protein n=1 Tax=Piedraia hortae CBS 480.64 TaxID=1314780 RepID=A0A6A7BVE0_9PEZI|nr:P-loop containing nucleoside triphosphate hydrolase protein [Piedraia hortae CBS 480.64]
MNEHLVERFVRSRRAPKADTEPVEGQSAPSENERPNPLIRKYFFEDAVRPVEGGSWLCRKEIPTSSEILDIDTGNCNNPDIVEIVPNRPQGAWESKEEYLGALYELLREDCIRPLRETISQVRLTPTGEESEFKGTIGIYEKVHVRAVVCSTRGIALRVTFSIRRVGKQILWEQSKRLTTGSLVVLTPANDMFKTTAIVATVAARPLTGVQSNPPEVDLFIANDDELEIDPAKEFVMVEERSSFFEADRHTLLALQSMMREPFPLSEHLVDAVPEVGEPDFVKEHPIMDLTGALGEDDPQYKEVNVITNWPDELQSSLDGSQLEALRRILTKKLAIVQGPPGAGKTFVSTQAIRAILASRQPDDPPIIIACQTNHAVDQILRKIVEFESAFARLGGRSKDKDAIKERTMFSLRDSEGRPQLQGGLRFFAKKKMNMLETELSELLLPLKPDNVPMHCRILEEKGLLTKEQADSLETGASQWVQSNSGGSDAAKSPFSVWLGNSLVPVPHKQQEEDYGFEYEETDLAFEQLKEMEAENLTKDDEDLDSLFGKVLWLADNFTCRKSTGMGDSKEKAKVALKHKDMWKIPEGHRGAVYRYLQQEMKRIITDEFRNLARQYNKEAREAHVGRFEENEVILKKQKIVGMTTTGLSKYRGLIASLQPRIVLIEEAAETLEAPVTVACMPTVQQLILVGDHKQLRPHTHVQAHEDSPYWLNLSLFERMLNNGVEFSFLSRQRRMIPEIRRILRPIYGDLIIDHPAMSDPGIRPDVPGMGGVNSFFMSHNWPEQHDDQMSAYNQREADMIVGFVEYLIYNNVGPDKITILTFYNGQRKFLLSALRKCPGLAGRFFNVVTVDSYQGEENNIVILSLVRSNENKKIGFLSIDNRVCVALSRAQMGLYIFGDGEVLFNYETWAKVINIMALSKKRYEKPKNPPFRRLADYLPVKCDKHQVVTQMRDPDDWKAISGGCKQICTESLACGHLCRVTCHPFPHDIISCDEGCERVLPCGHPCGEMCGEPCICPVCKTTTVQPAEPNGQPEPSADQVGNVMDTKEPTPLLELDDHETARKNLDWSREQSLLD